MPYETFEKLNEEWRQQLFIRPNDSIVSNTERGVNEIILGTIHKELSKISFCENITDYFVVGCKEVKDSGINILVPIRFESSMLKILELNINNLAQFFPNSISIDKEINGFSNIEISELNETLANLCYDSKIYIKQYPLAAEIRLNRKSL